MRESAAKGNVSFLQSRQFPKRFEKVPHFSFFVGKTMVILIIFCYKRIQNVCVSATPRKLPKRIGSMLASSRRVHARFTRVRDKVSHCYLRNFATQSEVAKRGNASSRRGPPAHHDGPFGKALSAAAPLLYISTIYLPSYIP